MQVTDPVCGTTIEIDQAAAHEDYRGWAYFFCSARCHSLFMANREQFVGENQRFAPSPASEALEE